MFKQFRNIIRDLLIGDIVEVYGGVRKKPLTINIEKIDIKYLVDDFIKIENPICPICKKHMKSKGKNQGYKCLKCKTEIEDYQYLCHSCDKKEFFTVVVAGSCLFMASAMVTIVIVIKIIQSLF